MKEFFHVKWELQHGHSTPNEETLKIKEYWMKSSTCIIIIVFIKIITKYYVYSS